MGFNSIITRTTDNGNGTVTTAGTPVQLSTLTNEVYCKRVRISAAKDNGATRIVAGDSNVDGTTDPPKGSVVLASAQADYVYADDTRQVWIDASANGGKFTWAIER